MVTSSNRLLESPEVHRARIMQHCINAIREIKAKHAANEKLFKECVNIALGRSKQEQVFRSFLSEIY